MKETIEETPRLSHLAHSLKGSQIIQYSNAVKNLKSKGKIVYNYTVGDFDPLIFPIPIELKKEIMKAYAEDYTNYPQAEGNPDLREAISLFEKTFAHIEYDSNEIIVASGGRPLIFAACYAICDKGDKVVYGVPSWNNNYYSQLTGSKAIEIEARPENGFLLTPHDIQPHMKDAVLLCLCSPQNPTGTLFTKETLKSISEMVLRENERRLPDQKKLYILFDAMYGNLATKASSHHNPITVCPEVKPYVITLGAISKVFAATGVRVGWCLGPSPVLQKMKNLLTHMGAWAPMAEQKAVARFLPQTDAIKRYLKNFKGELSYRLDAIYSGIKNLRKGGFPIDAVAPQGGLYLSIRIDLIGRVINGKKIETAADISEYLLQQSSFAVLPFSVFGSSDELPWFRISVGTSQKWDIPVMIKKLEEALTPFRFVEQPLSSI